MRLSLHEHTRAGQLVWFVQQQGQPPVQHSDLQTRLTPVLLVSALQYASEKHYLELYKHSLLSRDCKFFWCLDRACAYTFGPGFTSQRSFIARRMQVWLARLHKLGLGDLVSVHQTHEGCQNKLRAGNALVYGMSVPCEDQWSMSTSTFLAWLLSLTVSVRATGVIGLNTDASRPRVMLRALLDHILGARSLVLSAVASPIVFSLDNCLLAVEDLLTHADRYLRAHITAMELPEQVHMEEILHAICKELTVKKHR
eukprot:6472489-Amphidinium_carterae.1